MLSPTEREDLLARILRVLEQSVRPDLNAIGGAVELVGIDEDRIVQVRLRGACPPCGSASYAFLMVIESAVRAEVPEIRFVEAVP